MVKLEAGVGSSSSTEPESTTPPPQPMDEATEPADEGPGVGYPPPLLFLAALVTAMLVNRVVPLPLAPPDQIQSLRLASWIVLALGALLAVSAVSLFRRAGTEVSPLAGPATALVTEGPYRFTRNPMYLALSLMLVWATLFMNTWWPLIVLLPTLAVLQRTVIEREERHLEARFGEDFRSYRRRVRRWL
jgi:protein-S-isoprenylcysteine O-methyltransferase Ste14